MASILEVAMPGPKTAMDYLVEGLEADIRKALKEPLMAAVEKDIDAVVDKAVADMNIRAQSYVSPDSLRQQIVVSLRREA